MREVAGKLGTHDVAAALLVCREWRDGFANGMTSLRPRMLRIAPLAARCGACLGTIRNLEPGVPTWAVSTGTRYVDRILHCQ